MDLDYKLDGTYSIAAVHTVEEWNVLLQTIIGKLMDFLETRYPLPHRVQPAIWSCHRDHKFSSHLYFRDIWFKTTVDCGNFIRSFLELHPDYRVLIDELIYPRQLSDSENAPVRRQLRMPMSIKHAGGHRLSLDHGEETVAAFRNSIVKLVGANKAPKHGVQNLGMAPFHTWEAPVTTRDESRANFTQYTSSSTLTKEEDHRLREWLKRWKQVTHMESWHGSPDFHINSIYCPAIGNRHTSNHMFMHIVDRKYLRFTCTFCRVSFDGDVNISYILEGREQEIREEILRAETLIRRN